VFIPRAAFGGALRLAWFELFFEIFGGKVHELPPLVNCTTTTTAAARL
jgi:hypothetical protein